LAALIGERVEVEWQDSEADPEWTPLAQALAEAETEVVHRTCGYLLAATEGYLLVALNRRDPVEGQREMVADTIRIPRAVVSCLYRLTEAERLTEVSR